MRRFYTPKLKKEKKAVTPVKIILIALLPIMIFINYMSSLYPYLTEKYYSSLIYPYISLAINKITSIYPYSLMEILIIAALVLAVILIIKLIKKIKSRSLKSYHMKRFIINAICAVSCIYTAFCLLCGFNYNRLTFSYLAGYETAPASVDTLYNMCVKLADEANRLREEINQPQSVFTLDGSMLKISSDAAKYYDNIHSEYPFLTKGYSAPKPVIFSEVMSYLNITGVIFPYTMEANVNIASPDFLIPSTMCHELSHVRGFMREDEANFISYLVCKNSDDVQFKYSGTMLALTYSANALYSEDKELFTKLVNEHYSEEMLIDLRDDSRYWAEHSGFLSDVSTTVNNSYLKINRQTDGVKSYGRMVDLLIAEYQKENLTDGY